MPVVSGVPVVLPGMKTEPVPSSLIVDVPAVPVPDLLVAVSVKVSGFSLMLSFSTAARTSMVVPGIVTAKPV